MELTDIPTGEGWLSLALVVDLFSRRTVGWAKAATMTSRLVVDALLMAVGRRGEVAGLIAHSDRGSRSAREHDQAELARQQMVGGMSGVGQCWDHAGVERTLGRRKVERVHGEKYDTREDAKASIVPSIEVFSNRVRRHSTPESKTPDGFERTHNPDTRSTAVHFP